MKYSVSDATCIYITNCAICILFLWTKCHECKKFVYFFITSKKPNMILFKNVNYDKKVRNFTLFFWRKRKKNKYIWWTSTQLFCFEYWKKLSDIESFTLIICFYVETKHNINFFFCINKSILLRLFTFFFFLEKYIYSNFHWMKYVREEKKCAWLNKHYKSWLRSSMQSHIERKIIMKKYIEVIDISEKKKTLMYIWSIIEFLWEYGCAHQSFKICSIWRNRNNSVLFDSTWKTLIDNVIYVKVFLR